MIMAKDNNNKFAAIALLLSAGIVIGASTGILFLLDSSVAVTPKSEIKTIEQ
ncbi:MAG: hypothetical protein WA984_18435 [Phormidesmis sp.]